MGDHQAEALGGVQGTLLDGHGRRRQGREEHEEDRGVRGQEKTEEQDKHNRKVDIEELQKEFDEVFGDEDDKKKDSAESSGSTMDVEKAEERKREDPPQHRGGKKSKDLSKDLRRSRGSSRGTTWPRRSRTACAQERRI